MNPLDGEAPTRFLAPSLERLLTQYCGRKGLNYEMLSMRRIPGRRTIKRFLLSGGSVAMRQLRSSQGPPFSWLPSIDRFMTAPDADIRTWSRPEDFCIADNDDYAITAYALAVEQRSRNASRTSKH